MRSPPDVQVPAPRFYDLRPTGRVSTAERDADERKRDFLCIECGLTEEEARQESGRCLRCDHFGYGIFKGGTRGKMVTIEHRRQASSGSRRAPPFWRPPSAAGIPIPHLCYLKDINEIAACRMCVVEVEGTERLAARLQQPG